jgi:hypothetical protein
MSKYYCNVTSHSVPSGSVYKVMKSDVCKWIVKPFTCLVGTRPSITMSGPNYTCTITFFEVVTSFHLSLSKTMDTAYATVSSSNLTITAMSGSGFGDHARTLYVFIDGTYTGDYIVVYINVISEGNAWATQTVSCDVPTPTVTMTSSSYDDTSLQETYTSHTFSVTSTGYVKAYVQGSNSELIYLGVKNGSFSYEDGDASPDGSDYALSSPVVFTVTSCDSSGNETVPGRYQRASITF